MKNQENSTSLQVTTFKMMLKNLALILAMVTLFNGRVHCESVADNGHLKHPEDSEMPISENGTFISQHPVSAGELLSRVKVANLKISNYEIDSSCIKGVVGFFVHEGHINFVADFCKGCMTKSGCSSCSCPKRETIILGNGMCQLHFSPLTGTFIDENICSIGSYVMKSECHNPTTNMESWLWMKDSKSLSFVQDYDLIQTANLNPTDIKCKGECVHLECASGICSGDEEFCQRFGCLQDSRCFCKLGSPNFIVRVDGVEHHPLCFGINSFEVRRAHNIRKRSLSTEGSLSLKCMSNELIISSMTDIITKVKICISPKCDLLNFTGTTMIYKMTEEQTISKSDAIVEFWSDDDARPLTTLTAACRSDCPVVDCYVCKDVLLNLHCVSTFQKFLLFIEIVIILVVSMILTSLIINLFKILYILHLPIKFLWKLVKYPFRKINKRIRPTARRYYDEIMEEGELETFSEFKEMRPSPSVGRRPKVHNYLSFVLISLFLPLGYGCSETSTLTVNMNDCTYSGNGIESCLVTSKTRLAVSPIGQDSCFTIVNNENKAIANLVINTKDIRIRCKREDLYHVFNPDVKCPSHFNCAKAGYCFGDDPCDFKSDKQIDSLSSVNNNLGWTRCVRASGCAGNGCALCADSCIFYRAALTNPSKESYSVFSCPTWEYMVDLSARLLTVTNSSSGHISLSPGVKENLLGFKVSLISISSPPKPLLSQCFLSNGNNVAIAPCNKRNEYSVGKIGEIQCPNSNSAKQASTNCYTNENNIQIRKLDQAVSCSGVFVDVQSIFSQGTLPIKAEGLSLIAKGNSVEALESGTSILEIQIESNKYKLSSRTETNKCFLRLEQMTGCYSCLTAATLTFVGKTDFGTATSQVICPDSGVNFPLSLTHTEERIQKIVLFHKQNIDEKCLVRCPAGDTEVIIRGTLSYIENKITVLNLNSEQSPSNSASSFNLSFISEYFSNSFFRMLFPIFAVLLIISVLSSFRWNTVKRIVKRE